MRGCSLFMVFLLPSVALAESKPGDVMIEKYLAQETAKISQRFMDGAKTLDDWRARRPRLKQEYFDMLGLWPLPEKTPLHAAVTGSVDRDAVVIEKLHLQSRPGLYVTGNLYRPKKVEGKLPAVLYVCGHSGRGRDGNKSAFQDHGMWFASNGYICLIIDTLQLGEIPGIHHGTYREGRWWWQARGYTPAGVECWNGIRAIDYLVSRPDVDAERIAVTGISGGGASTIWIAAADERVKCAVPVSGMSDLESYVSNKIINGHCDCMLMINTYQWEWTTIAALIAPRPMLFCNSDKDPIFPMDANRRIIARLRQCYAMYGKPELVNDYVSHGGHDYRPDLRMAVFRWINKHIKGETAAVKDAEFTALPGKELRVFPEDKDIPKNAINGQIDESFVPKAKIAPLQKEGNEWQAWQEALIKEMREKSFRKFPRVIPAAQVEKKREEQSPLYPLTTEQEVEAFHLLIQQGDLKKVTLMVADYDEVDFKNEDWLADLVKPSLALLEGKELAGFVLTRGIGSRWTRKSPPNYVERSLALLGRTVDEGRVWDICAQVNWIKEMGPKPKRDIRFRVVGRKQAGILAAYAALLEPSISEVVVIDPPVSHRDGPIFLNVLRVLDIPEALGMLAPKKLALVNAKDKAFDRTVKIYKIAGAADKITRK